MREYIHPTSRSMKRASEVLRSKMCVEQRLSTERVDNLQRLHVLVKAQAGSRLRESRYQIYRVLLLRLQLTVSLHNFSCRHNFSYLYYEANATENITLLRCSVSLLVIKPSPQSTRTTGTRVQGAS